MMERVTIEYHDSVGGNKHSPVDSVVVGAMGSTHPEGRVTT